MKDVVRKFPDSYSVSNVSGRTKIYEYDEFKLKGTWEVIVAEWLDSLNIKWTNKIRGFEYFFDKKIRLYFPDFYLKELNLYIEVKGFERKMDHAKWSNFPEKLIIIKNNEINKIKKGELSINFLK